MMKLLGACYHNTIMPTLSVFFRKEDVEKWKAIKNKSEFMHHALNPEVRFIEAWNGNDSDKIPRVESYSSNFKPVKTPVNTTTAAPSIKFCKIHGIPLDNRGKCLQKGCKYS